MDRLKQKFKDLALPMAKELKDFIRANGNMVVDEVKLSQLYGGMRGVKSLITLTSLLDADEGIRFRGYSIPELRELLPKSKTGTEPLPEGIFYLMLFNELPSEEDVRYVTNEWSKRSQVPVHVFNALDALPTNMHPMSQLSIGILALQSESKFAKAYQAGISKTEYWDPTYEDVMNLLARLPRIAAYIYRRTYHNGNHIEPDPNRDWASNFAHMLGFQDDGFKRLMRLYLTIHADHEGGNVSAHTTHLVGSTLSDAYYAFAAAMCGLAGPLHGLANQEVIRWILSMREEIGVAADAVPTEEQVADFIKATLAAGKVVPGYGHPVLRQTDPRFTAQKVFAEKYFPEDPIVQTVWQVYKVAPGVLREKAPKIKNPWPNVDAHSGSLLMHFGLEQYEFYTVLFGVSRAMGVLATLCWDRALGLPIERPKSVSYDWVMALVNEEG